MASDAARLDVDGAAAPGGDLGEREESGDREQNNGGCERERAPCGRDGPALSLAPANRVQQIRSPGKGADKPMQPAEEHLAAAHVADALDGHPELLDPAQERIRGQVHDVERQVEREPALSEKAGLRATPVGDGDNEQSTRGERPRRLRELSGRVRKVLERVEEEDRGPAPADVGDRPDADVVPARPPLETERSAAGGSQAVENRPFATTDVENRAGRRVAGDPVGQEAARSAVPGRPDR